MRTAEDNQRVAGDVHLLMTRRGGALVSNRTQVKQRSRKASCSEAQRSWRQGAGPYNDTKSIPQRRAERLELRWGPPRQYRSHGGGRIEGCSLRLGSYTISRLKEQQKEHRSRAEERSILAAVAVGYAQGIEAGERVDYAVAPLPRTRVPHRATPYKVLSNCF